MQTRSFRLSPEDLVAIRTIADHLALTSRRSPNQTKALSWAVAQGVAAVEAAEKQGCDIPAGLRDEIKDAASLLQRLALTWERTAASALWEARAQKRALSAQETELNQLRSRVTQLEADLERAKSTPYLPPKEEAVPEAGLL